MNPGNVSGEELTKPTEGACVSNVSTSGKGIRRKTDWLAVVRSIRSPDSDNPTNPLSAALTKPTEGMDWNDIPDPATADEPFDQDAMDAIKAGHAVPVWSTVLGEWLWWVRDDNARKTLVAQGCRVPVYTLGELVLVAGMDAEALRDIHAFKREFGAVIKEPRREPR